MKNLPCLLILLLLFAHQSYSQINTTGQKSIKEVDVCVFGATPSGITAAISAKREGKTVLIVEPRDG